MTPTAWMIWAVVLLAQNSTFTLVSRARNSGSLRYHAVAAMLSNSVWFLSQFFVVGLLTQAQHNMKLALGAGVLYLILTTISSVAMHWFLMRKVEVKIKGANSNG
jgi:hypothetical protein